MRKNRLIYGLIAASAFIIYAMIIGRQQPQGQQMAEVRLTPSIVPSPVSAAIADPSRCRRPYPVTSIWNVPVDWTVARIHPMSAQMMSAFFDDSSWIGTDASQYTPNVYLVTNVTPLVPVRLEKNRFRDAINDTMISYGEPAGVVQMPLPAEARPAVGTDGQLVIVNTDTGEEWGLNEGAIDGLGNWSAGGVYRYSTRNSGIPPDGFGQRGAGIGQLAGIVRRCEVDRGRIEHAVTIAYDYPCAPEVCQLNGWPAQIPPFRKTDGEGTSQYDIPEGARMAIRPEINEQEIVTACGGIRGCELWVTAMQQYGGFIVDKSDHPKSYGEGNLTANWDASLWSEDMLRNIPLDWYVVIDWNYPSTKAP